MFLAVLFDIKLRTYPTWQVLKMATFNQTRNALKYGHPLLCSTCLEVLMAHPN